MDKKKNILIIYSKGIAEVFNRQSALGSYIYCLAAILQENNYSVFINGEQFDSGKNLQKSISIVSSRKPGLLSKLPGILKANLKDLRLLLSLKKMRERILQHPGCDLVMEFYSYGSDLGISYSRKFNVPLVTIYDAPVMEEYKFFNSDPSVFHPLVRSREKKTLQGSSSVVVYSTPVKDYVLRLAERALNVEIHQNVDFSRFDFIYDHAPSENLNIGFIGSFLRWHSVEKLLKAFIRLRKERGDLRLLLLGQGEDFARIREMAANSEFAADIVLPGYVDGDTLFNLKKQIHIGVMPGSNWYGAPNKIFEYGAAGMSVAAPATPTIKDLFSDGEELLLFKEDDEEGLYQVLRRLCSDPQLRRRLAAGLQQKIRDKYSKSHTFEFYNTLIKKAGK
jgi:glycosyltransferase involved in cell wall biosynthesis